MGVKLFRKKTYEPPQDAGLWRQLRHAPLHFQLRRIRWIAPFFVLLGVSLHQLVLQNLINIIFPRWEGADFLVYGLSGSVAVWLGLSWLATAVASRAEAELNLRSAYEELDANHQQLLALHDLGQNVAAASDEQAVLEMAARAPIELIGADSSTVISFSEGTNRLKLDMAWGLSETYLRALRTRIDAGVMAERCRTCTSLHAHSSSDCPLFDGLQAQAQAEGIGSLVCVPIDQANERIAVLSAYFPSANGPPDDQLRLLNILGGIIAATLDNFHARKRQTNALHALDRAVQSSDALDDLAAQALQIAVSGWEAQAGGLFLYDADSQSWTCAAQYELGSGRAVDIADETEPRFALGLEMAQRVLGGVAPLILSDMAEATHGLRAAAAAPLVTEGRTLGVLFLGATRPQALNARHMDLLATMAHQVVLAVRNAQLYAKLGQMAVVEERYRLSREFHDGLAQTLGYLGLQAERLESLLETGQVETAVTEFDEMRRSIRAAYADVREAIDGLRLKVEDPGQLAERLAEYTAEFARQTGLQVQFTAVPDNISVEPEIALQLLRIAQEALTNVRKHAQAQCIEISLRASNDQLELAVLDDGHGFPDTLPVDRDYHSYGLDSMRERAEQAGGTLTVSTQPGQGTRIAAVVPLKNRHESAKQELVKGQYD